MPFYNSFQYISNLTEQSNPLAKPCAILSRPISNVGLLLLFLVPAPATSPPRPYSPSPGLRQADLLARLCSRPGQGLLASRACQSLRSGAISLSFRPVSPMELQALLQALPQAPGSASSSSFLPPGSKLCTELQCLTSRLQALLLILHELLCLT